MTRRQLHRTVALGLALAASAGRPAFASIVHDSTANARRLRALTDAIVQHQLETDLAARLQAGVPVERLPDPGIEGAQSEGRWAAAQARELATITTSGLSTEERITWRMLRWQLALAAEAPRYHWLSFGAVTPYSSKLRTLTQALAALPLRTGADRDRFLRVQAQVPAYLNRIDTEIRMRAARGIRLTAPEIAPSLVMMRAFRATPDVSGFAPSASQLAQIDSASRDAFAMQARAVVGDRITPALDALIGVFDSSYVAQAPTAVGLSQYPGGRAYYRYLVRLNTTTDLTPTAIHAIGLREVARAEREMAAIRAEVGFTGSARAFLEAMRKDPRWYAKTPDEVGERLTTYLRRIEPELPKLFLHLPRAKGDVRRLDPRLEAGQTFGYYDPPSPTDSMGHYYYNGSNLPERPLMNAASLAFHEILPGHHFQISLQLENTELPAMRRNSVQTAYIEGWGEYASRLAGEAGLLADPYDRYGRLLMDMFLSCRLVVDTGMNEFGWSRERASAYMLERVLESPTQIASETLRYSADIQGQALSYKLGVIEFLRMREKAQAALGPQFDLRAFHDVVLSSGSLPMTVLSWKVDQWLAQQHPLRR